MTIRSKGFLVVALMALLQCGSDRKKGQLKPPSGEAVAYRMLYRLPSAPVGLGQLAEYTISVDVWLSEGQFSALLCKVIEDEAPEDFDILRIRVMYRLDEYVKDLFHNEELTARNRAHSIGLYNHMVRSPDRPSAVSLGRSESGEFIEPSHFFSFDHNKDCP